MKDGNPQTEDGFTRIANELFEAMILKMPYHIPNPILIFLAVMRETYGFSRKSSEISTKRFREITGIEHRNNIYRAIKEAVNSHLIIAITSDGKSNATYSINKNYKK
jgi:phage replication O-like protein O